MRELLQRAASWCRSPRGHAVLAIVGFWLVAFFPKLFSDAFPYYRDQLNTNLGLRAYLHERLKAGHLPLWYPYEGLGIPFIGQVLTATFHPQTFLFLPFDPLVAIKLNTFFAFLFGGGGAYRAARAVGAGRVGAVLGAIAFMFGGYTLGISHKPNYLMAHCTIPWVFAAAVRVVASPNRRAIAELAVCCALVFLAGADAQAVGFCLVLILAAFATREAASGRAAWVGAGRLAGAVGLSVLLVSVELVPALALSRDAIRVVGRSDPLLGRLGTLHPLRLIELAVPGIIPDAYRVEVAGTLFQEPNVWATTIFAGTVVLVLAALGAATARRPGRVLAGTAVLAFWLSMGDRGGLLPLVWKAIPQLTSFRTPEKYAGPAWLALSCLSALGLSWVAERPKRGLGIAVGLSALFALVAVGLEPLHWAERLFASRGLELSAHGALRAAVLASWERGLLAGAAASAGLALALGLGLRDRRAILLVPVIGFAELAAQNLDHVPTAPRHMLVDPEPFSQLIRAMSAQSGGPSPRVLPEAGGHASRTLSGGDPQWAEAFRRLLRPQGSGLWGIGSLMFDLPLTTRRSQRLFVSNPVLGSRLAPLYGVCFRVTDSGAALPAQDRLLLEQPEFSLQLSQTPCAPRAYLAAARPVSSDREALRAVVAGLPPETVVWEGGPLLANARGSLSWREWTPEHLRFDVSAEDDTALVLNDEWMPGWEGTLDGRPAPIYVTNAEVRGMRVPRGKHQLEMTFHTPGLLLGALLSLLGLGALVALLF